MVFDIKESSIIYVVCPANKKTGGTELAHQLVKELKDIGRKVFITYYGVDSTKNPINEAFLEYVNEYKCIFDIQDSPNNILIVPEINFTILDKYNVIQKAIWWMSVDNYIKNDGFIGACLIDGIYKAIRGVLSGRLTLKKKGFDTSITHFYQSEYAHDYLLKNGVKKCFQLSDYINDSYLNQNIPLEKCNTNNVVLYNPKKGIKFTKKLIDKSIGIKWIPIENMTTQQVKSLLGNSKVYVDFGNHPGKDRFPREAAIMGCCVITGKRGSAKFYKDIPIPSEFKFSENKTNIIEIISKINKCLDEYEEESKKYNKYKYMIRHEHEIFKKDVMTIFN